MKINKTQLQQALSVVKPGVSNKEVLEQTTSFAFLAGRVVSYNDEISISHPVKDIDFEGAIKAQELYALLLRINKEEIEIEVQEGEVLIQAGRVKAGLKLETEIKLPLKTLPSKMFEIPNQELFKEFVGLAMRTCSVDMVQPKLTCVCIKQDGTIISSDGYRLMHGSVGKLPVRDFLLPATCAVEAVKLNPTHIFLEKSWVHFKNAEGTVISCRTLDDDYMPDESIQEVLNVKEKGSIEFPPKIEEMIDRVQQFAKRDSILDEKIEVTVEENKITLKASSEETGSWIEERASIKCDNAISFTITPSLFGDILGKTRSCVVDKSLTKMRFKGENWQYILMLRDPQKK